MSTVTGPIAISVVSEQQTQLTALSVTSRAVTVPAGGAETKIAAIETAGIQDLYLVGTVGGTGPLTDLRIACASHDTDPNDVTIGQSASELSGVGGDFAIATDFLRRATGTPHTTATGNSFRLAMHLAGAIRRVDVFAKSSAGASLTIDATGASVIF